MTKRTHKFPRQNTWQKTHSKALLCCISLANQKLLDLIRFACKFDLDQIERKSSQVNASRSTQGLAKLTRKYRPNPSSQLASSPFDQGFIKISLLSILVYSLKGGYVVYGGHGADVLTFPEIRKETNKRKSKFFHSYFKIEMCVSLYHP